MDEKPVFESVFVLWAVAYVMAAVLGYVWLVKLVWLALLGMGA